MTAITANSGKEYGLLSFPVLVAALGYFVDLYDLILFSATRLPALRSFGVAEADLFQVGVLVTNIQTAGLIIGGLLFGILADKFGRTRLMFASIVAYSLATLAGAFVTNLDVFMALRFIAGIGLAGEVGLAVTLVAEILPKAKRGYGTALIASFGLSGAVVAGLCAQALQWQTCYIIGGVMGLMLLALRALVAESPVFLEQTATVAKGHLKMLFNGRRLKLLLLCVLAGAPVNFMIFIVAAFAPELTGALGLSQPLAPAIAIIYAYIGLVVGDLVSGLLSQWFSSRRRVVQVFLLALMACFAGLLFTPHADSEAVFKLYYFLLGFFAGIWIVVCTMAVELFGTNLRATIGSTVPNLIRATFLISSTAVATLKPAHGLVEAIAVVGGSMLVIAFIAISLLPETSQKDLRYVEE